MKLNKICISFGDQKGKNLTCLFKNDHRHILKYGAKEWAWKKADVSR
jgi:hypothetical protein